MDTTTPGWIRPFLPLSLWLLVSRRTQDPAVQRELRNSMQRRMWSLLISASLTVFVTCVVGIRNPDPWFKIWLVLNLAVVAARIAIVIAIRQASAGDNSLPEDKAYLLDALVLAGTVWSVLLGLGCGLCLSTGDLPTSIMGCLLAMGTVGAQCARSPGAPRLAFVQMAGIVLPFIIGGWLAHAPDIKWVALMGPFYLIGMASITDQLNADFVEMISSRLENHRLAQHCGLTGLPNRLLFEKKLDEAIEAARCLAQPVVLMCLDLDGFKTVNDRFGHPAGDRLLVAVAARLKQLERPGDTAARLGGDEFALVMPFSDIITAETLANRIITSLAAPFALGAETPVTIGVSIGLATGQLATGSADLLLTRADQALYQAKRSGRGRFCWSHQAERQPVFNAAGRRQWRDA